jgi:hypothetical protein
MDLAATPLAVLTVTAVEVLTAAAHPGRVRVGCECSFGGHDVSSVCLLSIEETTDTPDT